MYLIQMAIGHEKFVEGHYDMEYQTKSTSFVTVGLQGCRKYYIGVRVAAPSLSPMSAFIIAQTADGQYTHTHAMELWDCGI